MIEDDIRRLAEREHGTDLGRLEADIWRREAVFQACRRAMRRVVIWQGVLLAGAVIGSATAGAIVSQRSADRWQAALTMPGERHAPSTLLFGVHQ